jgi:peptidoglycan/LPS O-acetylase OafA/YrhL
MLRARFSRIYPSYLVVTILTMLAVVVGTRLGKGMEGGYPFNAIPVRLLLMQTWPYFTWAITPWTGPLWFLSAIASAYVFAFPCAWLLIRRVRSTWAILFWVFVPLAVGSAATRIGPLHEFFIVLRACGGFISGSALFALYSNGSPVILAAQKHLDKTAALFLAASAFLPVWPSEADRQFVSLLLLLAGPVIMAGLTGGSSLTVRLLSIRPLAWLASISYSIYISHYFAECLLHVVLPTGRFANSHFLLRGLVAAVYFLVVLVSAIGLHRLVEVPCAKALKSFSFTRLSNVFIKRGPVAGLVPTDSMTRRSF